MVILLVIESQEPLLTLLKTAAIGVYLEFQTHGMSFSMLSYCQWDIELGDTQEEEKINKFLALLIEKIV